MIIKFEKLRSIGSFGENANMKYLCKRSLPVQLSLTKLFTFRWQSTYAGRAFDNAAAQGDAREIIALTKQIGEEELKNYPELEEAYRMALLQVSD